MTAENTTQTDSPLTEFDRLKSVFNISQVEHKELSSSKTGELFSHSAVLTGLIGFKDFFVHHEILSPNRRSSSPHRHSQREEMVIVLKGNPTAHMGRNSIGLSPNDFIGFRPDSQELHFIENSTVTDVELLIIASGRSDDEVIYNKEAKPYQGLDGS